MMKFFLIIPALLHAASVNSQTVAPSGPILVRSVTMENSTITVSGDGYTNPQQCSHGFAFIIGNSAETKAMYLSLAMTALASNLKLNIWTLPGCVNHINGTIAVAYHVSLIK